MSDAPVEQEPWVELARLFDADEVDELATFVEGLPPAELARAMSRLDESQQKGILQRLEAEAAADLIEQLPDVQAASIVETLEPAQAAAILDELPSDERADLIGDLETQGREAILAEMLPEEAADLRQLASYPAESAGGLMATEVLAYPGSWTVAEVTTDMAANADKYRDYDVQYAYVQGSSLQLVGVLRLRDLLLAPRGQRVADLMIRDPLSVPDTATLEELLELFDAHSFLGAPVVNEKGQLQGVVHRAAVDYAVGERHDSDYLKSQGIVGGEEIRSMTLWRRASRRLSWLSINMMLNLIAATVLSAHQDTLSSVIALAVFLPVLSDMSGCSGNQAVAVSLRELSLGLVRHNEILRVLSKELAVGLMNGFVLGSLLAVIAWVWQGNAVLGLVVGGALTINTLVAVCVGGAVPLVLKRFNIDPAVASGPLLTTATDLCGFIIVLTFASWFMPYLL